MRCTSGFKPELQSFLHSGALCTAARLWPAMLLYCGSVRSSGSGPGAVRAALQSGTALHQQQGSPDPFTDFEASIRASEVIQVGQVRISCDQHSQTKWNVGATTSAAVLLSSRLAPCH